MNRNTLSVGKVPEQTAAPTSTYPSRAPPIFAIRGVWPYFQSFISFLIPIILGVYRLLVNLAWQVVKPILVLSPIPIILYILAPVFTFCQVLLDVVVLGPVKTMGYMVEVIYPVYVFVGVGCITGCLLGFMGKYMSDRLVGMVVA